MNSRQLPRSEVALRIAEVARKVGLIVEPRPEPTEVQNYYAFLLSRNDNMVDGSVRVYGPSSITIFYTTAIRDLPQRERVTLRSVEQAEEFLRSRFGSRVAA